MRFGISHPTYYYSVGWAIFRMNHTESPMNDDMNHSQIFEILTAEPVCGLALI